MQNEANFYKRQCVTFKINDYFLQRQSIYSTWYFVPTLSKYCKKPFSKSLLLCLKFSGFWFFFHTELYSYIVFDQINYAGCSTWWFLWQNIENNHYRKTSQTLQRLPASLRCILSDNYLRRGKTTRYWTTLYLLTGAFFHSCS
jgi:hypothetical protein